MGPGSWFTPLVGPVKLLIVFAAFGFAYGVVLQRSGFCFAKAGFELFLLRSRDAFNGVMAGLVVATLGFAVVSALRVQAGLDAKTHLLVIPFGAGTVVGATLFGMGMSLAGMCAAGTLQRIGEGYLVAWFTLLGIVAGAALDPFAAFLPESWRTQSQGVWLGDRFGALPAAGVAVLALLCVWLAVMKTQGAAIRWPARSWRSLISPAIAGGIALGLIDTAQVAFATPWTVAYPLALVRPALAGALSQSAWQAALPLLTLDAGLVLGSLASSAHATRARVRLPRRGRDVARALIGGVLMGWGIQLARGCGIGGAFSAIPSLSASAWLFLPSLFFGAWIGSRIIRRFD